MAAMSRRRFIASGCALLATVPIAVEAAPKIGYLSSSSATATAHFVEAFRQGLRTFGWVEGQNIVIEWRFAEGRFDQLPELATELVRLNVAAIVAAPTPAAVAAKKATGTIPLVMVNVSDPVGLGLVASLARPGGNATGVSYSVGVETFGKALELLKEAVPSVRRVAFLANAASPARAPVIKDLRIAAGSLGIQLQLVEAEHPDDFNAVFARITRERAEALVVAADSMFIIHRARLAHLAARNRLPAMYGIREHAETGGLMSYGPSSIANYRRSAFFVDKILKGVPPGDLPVEQPSEFELVINLKTAKALGLTIPPSLLTRADQVLE
jgi:putative ABC transport system substrate-binding protein